MNTLGIIERNYYRLERELFRGSDRRRRGFALRREVLLPAAAGVFSFFVSDGPISFNSERNGGKNAGKNCVFAFPSALRQYANLQPFTTRSQNRFHVVSYDELTSLLRRCRSCVATVEPKALFGVGISGSGAVAETVL